MFITNMIEQSDLLCCYLCIPFSRCKDCKYVSVVIVLYRHECIIIGVASFNSFRILK